MSENCYWNWKKYSGEAEIILNLSFKAETQKAELQRLDRLREMTDNFPFEEKASQEENSLQFEAKNSWNCRIIVWFYPQISILMSWGDINLRFSISFIQNKGRYESNDEEKYEEYLLLSTLFWSSIIFCKHNITQFCLETAAGCCSSQLQTELREKKKENLQ